MPATNTISDELPDDLVSDTFREGLIHQAVVTYEANQRRGLAKTQSKPDVSGPNKKPWRQKGTGRSRHGSEKTPLWVGGAVAHGPDGQRDFSKKMTQTMKHQALASALGVRRQEDQLLVIEPPELDEPSTSDMDDFFEEQELRDEEVLLLIDPDQRTLRLSTRNLAYCTPKDAASLNTYDVVSHSTIAFTNDGLDLFSERSNNGS